MCIVCEIAFWDMVDALTPEMRERIMRANAEVARLSCEAPADAAAAPKPPTAKDERKP
jgi:hypothetical protein